MWVIRRTFYKTAWATSRLFQQQMRYMKNTFRTRYLCRTLSIQPAIKRSTKSSKLRIGQPLPNTHSHLFARQNELTPGITAEEYAQRRKSLLQLAPLGSLLIVPAFPERIMANDVPYPFHQDTNFLYLTGFQEPDAVLVIEKPTSGSPRVLMFVRPRDPARELWDGPRAGVEGAKQIFGIDEAFSIYELSNRLKPLIASSNTIFFDVAVNPSVTTSVQALTRTKLPSSATERLREWLSTLRSLKSPDEQQLMRKSGAIAASAFIEVMRATRPGASESTLAARFEYECRKRGAARVAYPPVVASGPSATILHYISNDDVAHDGELLLVDAGAEYNNYASDITRTWPVNGKFTQAQKVVYDIVLTIQKHIISLCSPGGGRCIDKLHHVAVELTSEALVALGIMKTKSSAEYYKYFPHNIGHWLGLDTHDGLRSQEGSAEFQPGMVVTVEPGIYFDLNDEKVPEPLRGIGVRIEDDVLITSNGYEVLTAGAPKEIHELESIIGTAKSDL